MTQPVATKLKRPRNHRGPTNYEIVGYAQRFRYVQGGFMPNDPFAIHRWKVTDAPTKINGVFCVVAKVSGSFGFFAELPPAEVYG